MVGKKIFKIWAPVDTKWVDWIRPVPFITINEVNRIHTVIHFTIPDIHYIHEVSNDTTIILDLPGRSGIEEGIALARLGFRPIPIYNGTQSQFGAMAVVDNHLEQALLWGAYALQKIEVPKNAPPVFLLDSNRIYRYKMNASVFDNSWDVYGQDLPSAEYLINNGITKIIIRGNTLHPDLSKILFIFQKKGITIFFTTGFEIPKEITIKKPSRKQK